MATSGRFSPNKVRKRLLDDTWVFPNSGMVLMRPSSIVSTGTGASATIGTNGSVTFSTCATLSLNGVFTSGFDNYMVVMRDVSSATTQYFYRLRLAGTDASGANYTYQYIQADSTTVNGARTSSATAGWCGYSSSTQRSGQTVYLYGPNLAQPTAVRSVSVVGADSGRILDNASTHSLSTAYDGITIYPNSPVTFSGLISVYGLGG